MGANSVGANSPWGETGIKHCVYFQAIFQDRPEETRCSLQSAFYPQSAFYTDRFDFVIYVSSMFH